MDHSSSITTWIEKVKGGDPDSAQKIWERYCRELVELARKRVVGTRLPTSEDQTIVQQAFEAFFRAAKAGKLTLLHDRHDLWRLLVVITEGKARDSNRRGPGVQDAGASAEESDVGSLEDSTQTHLRIDEPSGPTPTPEFAALAVEEMRRLLMLLNDPQLTRIAVMKMAGHTHEEIAQRLGCVPDTVGRKLRLIHNAWRQEIGSS